MAFMDRPLLIVCFQGVLGDFIKSPPKKDQTPVPKSKTAKNGNEERFENWNNLNLRNDAISGLRYLSSCFQLVIFSRESLEDSWGQESQIEFGGQTKTIK
jgi:hypothetical protein